MSKPMNKTMIGTFIAGAIALVTIAVLFLGSGRLFKETTQYVMYFSGSVRGLGLGAPVQLKGIPIGNVTDINLVYNEDTKTFINQVIFDVQKNLVKVVHGSQKTEHEKQRLMTDTTARQLIETGLRAKLQVQSFVTGQLLVDCDFYPGTPVSLMRFDDNVKEIPTLPSEMEEVARMIDSIDLKSMVTSVQNVITGVEKLIDSPDMAKSLGNLNATMNSYRNLAENIDGHAARLSTEASATMADLRRLIDGADGKLDPVAGEITGLITDLRKLLADLDQWLHPVLENANTTTTAAQDMLKRADAMFGNLTYLTDENSPFIYSVDETMTEIRKAAIALGVLAEYLNRHPEALIRGKRPNIAEGK